MARSRTAAGALIAIDGTRGADVREAAGRLWRQMEKQDTKGGVSAWDASGTFTDLWMGKRTVRELSPRTLALMYAADLAFRLRWQIRPALEQGHTIVAAPYIESAIALAIAAGLPRKWLAEVLRFAPRPTTAYRVKERKKSAGWKGKPLDGFAEFSATALGVGRRGDGADLRKKMILYLDALERRKGCKRLTKGTGA